MSPASRRLVLCSTLLVFAWTAACSAPPPAPPPPIVITVAPPIPPAPAAAPANQPIDPAKIKVATRVIKQEDCGSSIDDYLRPSSQAPNQPTVRWVEQNMGDPFKTRVVVRPGSIRLEIESIDDPLGGLICGLQGYHLRTEISGLPAGSYRVVGPAQPWVQVGGKLVPTPRSRAMVAVAGAPAIEATGWVKTVSRRFSAYEGPPVKQRLPQRYSSVFPEKHSR